MKKIVVICLFALASVQLNAADRVGDFALLDQDGYSHQMSWYDDHTAIALLVQANGSRGTLNAMDEFEELQTRYEELGIEFFMLNSTGTQDRASVKAEMARHGSDMKVLIDDTQLISEALGVEKTGEVFLFDPNTFTVVFRGPVGAEFENAINYTLAGGAIPNPVVATTTGEPVAFPARLAHDRALPSYERDIAPIITDNCASCHREGGIAPFAMNNHAMMQAWAPVIREVLMVKRMPPGQIDPHIGDFVNGGIVADNDIQKLLHWFEAGAPRDGAVDPLAELTWPETKWAFGEPDAIIRVPPQEIPASGAIPYRYVTANIDIDGDKWVRASQYIAGDPTVLHHALHTVIPPEVAGQSRGFGGLSPSNADDPDIVPYVPGAEPRMQLPDTGGLLRKGSELALQLHYTANGNATVDAGEIGLWFYPEGEVPSERMSGSCACIFTPNWTTIPPHAKEFLQEASITLTRDAELHSFLSHMHFRGKYMRFYADYPDGTREELLNIADYNYAWQWDYQYAIPRLMPAGTKLTAVGAFDNSAQNPANPDPTVPLEWGEMSWDEMFFGAFRWKYLDEGDD
ncbi:MAG: redoxin domain-containing protein [Gammaproteobacteria bacterium]|nr:redoxin domain-containing protein [Gammaproteobacteria bacterium]